MELAHESEVKMKHEESEIKMTSSEKEEKVYRKPLVKQFIAPCGTNLENDNLESSSQAIQIKPVNNTKVSESIVVKGSFVIKSNKVFDEYGSFVRESQ